MDSIAAVVFLCGVAQVEPFVVPGYDVPVTGVWYTGGPASSAMPLGALGTGFVNLTAAGTFGDSTAENNWLSPRPVPAKCGLTVRVGDKYVALLPDTDPLPALRFWGHYPAADVDFGDTFGDVTVFMRAFAPLIPHDYALSGLPVAFFHFTATNTGSYGKALEIGLQWQALAETGAEGGGRNPAVAHGNVETIQNGVQIKMGKGSYAVAVMAEGEGWSLTSVPTERDVVRAQAIRTLDPGVTADVVLALAWNFPTWTSSDGETLRHRYAMVHPDAGSVLNAVLPRAGEIEKKIAAWQQSVYASLTPAYVKDAVINGLYIWPRNSWWLDDGRFFQSESFTGCPITETFVCRFNGSFPLALLFPECERATMRSIAKVQAESGEIPFAFGSPTGSRSPYFHVQHPIVSPEFVLVTWRNVYLWQDTAYLDEMYPHVQAALRYSMTLDKDGDGVIDEDPGSETGFPANQYYDIWPWWGTSAYTGSIWLAALRAGEEMAKRKGDAAFAQELRGWYDKASASFHDKLWTGAYYRLYNDPAHERASQTSLTNALCGQWFAYTCGLGEIVPQDTILSEIDAVLQWNVGATPYGAVNGVRTDGLPDETFPDHSAVITIGEVWNFCAMAAFTGKKDEAIRLFVSSYENILAKQRTPWNIPWSLDRKTGAIKWGINYYSNACVWTLFQALDPETYAKLAKPASE